MAFFVFRLGLMSCQDDGQVWTREEYLQRRAQLVDGRLLAGDASFKYAKVIRLPTGPDGTRARPVYGIFTIMNEYDQVGENAVHVNATQLRFASVSYPTMRSATPFFLARFLGRDLTPNPPPPTLPAASPTHILGCVFKGHEDWISARSQE